MRVYNVRLVGKTPLLMHSDNIEWADEMSRWKDDPDNRIGSKAGDDRSPAWRWLGSLYHDNEHVAVPGDNLMRCLMEAGAMVPVPGGKGGKTFKSQTQSGCVIGEPFWPLEVTGKRIAVAPLLALQGEADYSKHQTVVAQNGFTLFLKRAKIGSSKHVRVRPRFDLWSIGGTLNVWDDQLTLDVVRRIFTFAGQYKGLCDWRPGGRTPGSYGMFEATVEE